MSSENANQCDAKLYQSKHNFVWGLAGEMIELLAPKPAERILDLGCGSGELTAQIAESGADVIGLDQSPDMLAQAIDRSPGIKFIQGDAHRFSLAQPADAVFSNAMLHWSTSPIDVIESVARNLKLGGRFVVEFGGRGNVFYLCAALEKASFKILGSAIKHPWYFPSISEFATLLETSGLEVCQAAMIDRPTQLEGPEGLRNWVRMFGNHWLSKIPTLQKDAFLDQAESLAKTDLCNEEIWYADYRRLRLVAIKRE